ncbi:hypothetical protein ACE0DR_00380 [Azotobacter sp. CWF10]
MLDGGSGDDLLLAGAGKDTLNGGSGSDRIMGELDNDRLYADERLSDQEVLAANELDNGLAERGDLLSGDAGNDFVVGAQREDLLLGGSGRDQLFADAGNDVLYGDSGLLGSTSAWGYERLVTVNASTGVTTYSVQSSGMTITEVAATGQEGTSSTVEQAMTGCSGRAVRINWMAA